MPGLWAAVVCIANGHHPGPLRPLPTVAADARTICEAFGASPQNRPASRSTVLPADPGVEKPFNTRSIPAASRLGLGRLPGTALGPDFVGKLVGGPASRTSTSPSADEILDAIRAAPSDQPLVVFYSGHGDAAGDGELSWPTNGDRPWLPIGQVIEAMDAPTRPWSALIVNSCDAGYVDVRRAKRPFVLIGAGYGPVTGARWRGESSSVFTAALAWALSGSTEPDATEPDAASCGVTDEDLVDRIDSRLTDAAYAGEVPWTRRPVAVLRRQADAPIALVERPGCPREATGHRARNRVRVRTVDLRGAKPSPPVARLRDVHFVPDGPAEFELTLRPGGPQRIWARLVRPRDAVVIWRRAFASDVSDDVIRQTVIDALPPSVRVFGVGAVEAGTRPVWLQFRGAVRTSSVTLTRQTPPARHVVSLDGARVWPCPGGRGQCFAVDGPAEISGATTWRAAVVPP